MQSIQVGAIQSRGGGGVAISDMQVCVAPRLCTLWAPLKPRVVQIALQHCIITYKTQLEIYLYHVCMSPSICLQT